MTLIPESRLSLARAKASASGLPGTDNWASRGRCRGLEPDALFVKGAAQQVAKQVCLGCPVIAECLADALDNRTEFGVWGGMTERERRALLKRRPDVTSWRSVFENARSAGQAS